MTIGFYMLVSRYLETFGVDIEQAGGAEMDMSKGRSSERPGTRSSPTTGVVRTPPESAGTAPGAVGWPGGGSSSSAPDRRTYDLDDPPIGNGRAIAQLCAREGRTRRVRRP